MEEENLSTLIIRLKAERERLKEIGQNNYSANWIKAKLMWTNWKLNKGDISYKEASILEAFLRNLI